MISRSILFTKVQRKTARTPNVALGRIRRLVEQVKSQQGDIKSFAVISAYRRRAGYRTEGMTPGDLIPSGVNESNQQELEQALRALGYGFTKQQGLWVERQEGAPAQQVSEPSLFVPNCTFKHAVQLFERYHQDGVLYAGPETGGKVIFMGFERYGKPSHGEFGSRKPEVFEVGDFRSIFNESEATQKSFENQSAVQGRPFVFASYPALCRPRR